MKTKKTALPIKSDAVVLSFNEFLQTYNYFRKGNGLGNKTDAYEICTAILDKCGRIAREVKHKERNDPKENFPDGLTEAMTGTIVYLMMLIEKYQIDVSSGMKKELESALRQYSEKTTK